MQPKIALVMYTLFVFILLWLDGKKHGKLPYSLWIPLIWIMYCGSRAVSYWLYPETLMASEGNTLEGNPVDRIFLTSILASGIIILWRRRTGWTWIVRRNRWLVFLFLYMGITVLWSSFPEVSFKRWIRSIGDFVMILIVVTERDPLESTRRLLVNCSFVLIPMSVLLIKYFHDLGISYDEIDGTTMWIGVTTHKNSLGQVACLAGAVTAWQIIGSWRRKDALFYGTFAVFLMSAWILKGPAKMNSKTSVIVFLLSLSFLILSQIYKKRAKYFGNLILACLLIFPIVQSLLGDLFLSLFVSSAGRDMTLTGRTELWDELLRMSGANPVLGPGYGGFWVPVNEDYLWNKLGWLPESAHNGYLDIYLELGVVGIFLLIGVILSTYRNIAKTIVVDLEYGRIQLMLFILALVYNFTESCFAKPTNFVWFLFLLVAASVPRETQIQSCKEDFDAEAAWMDAQPSLSVVQKRIADENDQAAFVKSSE